MAVRVEHWKGAWWVFVQVKRRRKAKRLGKGIQAKRAHAVAERLAARLALGEDLFADERKVETSFESYSEPWIKTHASTACKFSTVRSYQSSLKKHINQSSARRP